MGALPLCDPSPHRCQSSDSAGQKGRNAPQWMGAWHSPVAQASPSVPLFHVIRHRQASPSLKHFTACQPTALPTAGAHSNCMMSGMHARQSLLALRFQATTNEAITGQPLQEAGAADSMRQL